MNLQHQNWSGRAPRSIEDAFGPHASNRITVPKDPMPKSDKIVLVACTLGAVAFVCMVAVGWIQ